MKIYYFIVIAILTACAGQDTKSLNKVSAGRQINFDKDFTYQSDDSVWTYTIKSGKYPERYKNSKGSYYEGDGKCLVERLYWVDKNSKKITDQTLAYRCGIFVSKNDSNIKVYFYRLEEFTDLTKKAGVLIHALDKAENDNIQIHPVQPNIISLKSAFKFE